MVMGFPVSILSKIAISSILESRLFAIFSNQSDLSLKLFELHSGNASLADFTALFTSSKFDFSILQISSPFAGLYELIHFTFSELENFPSI